MTTLPIVTPSNLGTDFDMGAQVANKINIVPATTTVPGKVRLAAAADLAAGTAGAAVDAAGLKSQLAGIAGSMKYQGAWNAATNTPQLLSGAGTLGYLYKVSTAGVSNATTLSVAAASGATSITVASATGVAAGQSVTGTGFAAGTTVASSYVAGSTSVPLSAATTAAIASGAAVTLATCLDGAGPFYVGDLVSFDGSTWDRYAGSSENVQTVAGRTGAITLSAADVTGVATPASVTAQASVQITDAFGNAIGHALP